MRIDGRLYRSIWVDEDERTVVVIDQTRLPHKFGTRRLVTVEDAAHAISSMVVRGAPLIGATAAYGVALALSEDPSDANLENAITLLSGTRPTAANLRWALEDLGRRLRPLAAEERAAAAYRRAGEICDEDVAINRAIGENGLALVEKAAEGKVGPVNVLTHCNAGWLATVDWGTALAPLYMAHDKGISVHVWVDETRPRNQGAALTAWELARHGVPHTLIVDNAGGHLMQQGMVDLCITGTDRTTARGDVCNKIGTYLKALAASDNDVPFYVALPHPTIDWSLDNGADTPIEQRDEDEVLTITGRDEAGQETKVSLTPPGSRAANYAFDVTPARLVTALITDRGVCEASEKGLRTLFPDCAAEASSS